MKKPPQHALFSSLNVPWQKCAVGWQIILSFLLVLGLSSPPEGDILFFGWVISLVAFWVGASLVIRRHQVTRTKIDELYLRFAYPFILGIALAVLNIAWVHYSQAVIAGVPMPWYWER